jgi:myo-inositol-1(or 4)-monophosphatase
MLGVILEPFCDELWTAIRHKPARLNGRIIRTSKRDQLAEAVVAIGFAKERRTLRRIVPAWNYLIHRVRKVRIMGSAALELAYVATGRLDAFLEYGLRIWDIAAGGLLVESAGGSFWKCPIPGPTYSFQVVASNRPLHPHLARFRKQLI